MKTITALLVSIFFCQTGQTQTNSKTSVSDTLLNRANNKYKKILDDPIFFIDNVNVTRADLQNYQPSDIAVLTVYKDTNETKFLGPQGKDGAVYIETKKFARNKYWNFFTNKSAKYLKAVPSPESDSSIAYILNGKLVTKDFIGDLSDIDESNFLSLEVIDKEKLLKYYRIKDKLIGIIIKAKPKLTSDRLIDRITSH
jgi:hypothetical protein